MKIVCLGDSFTAGPMVDEKRRWTDLLEKDLNIPILNRGISGDTTSGMLARLKDDCISEDPDYVMIIGGANDLICCGSLNIVKNNYMAMIHHLFHAGIKPILAMPIPCFSEMIPPLWQQYRDFSTLNDELEELNRWNASFSKSFMCHSIDIYSPMMEGFSDTSFVNGSYLDGLHLSEKGHRYIADVILDQLKGILR